MINMEIESDMKISLSINDSYKFIPITKNDTVAQTPYLVRQIWKDIVNNLAFTDKWADTFGIDRIKKDWGIKILIVN